MPPTGLEPAIPAGERLQTGALDRSATGIGDNCTLQWLIQQIPASKVVVVVVVCGGGGGGDDDT